MTEHEWESVAETIGELWPDFAATMTGEQVRVWRAKLANYALADVREALRDHYANHKYPTPNLAWVVSALFSLSPKVATGYRLDVPDDFVPLTVEQKREITRRVRERVTGSG